MKIKFILVLAFTASFAFGGTYYTWDGETLLRHKGETPYPTNAIVTLDYKGTQIELLTLGTNGQIRLKTSDELNAYRAKVEAEKQSQKPEELKAAENAFYDLCFQLFGDYTKRGFAEIRTKITEMQAVDPMGAVNVSLSLLAIDAEAKREGGNDWWDTAVKHEVAE